MSEKEPTQFERGSALSIFGSDRKEDLMALGIALAIALYVLIAY